MALVLKEIGFWTDFQDEEPKEEVEAKGQLRYRLEYDFTTQELKITVSAVEGMFIYRYVKKPSDRLRDPAL